MTGIHVRRAEEKDISTILRLLTQVCNVHNAGRPDLFRRDQQKYRADELKILIRDDTRPIFVAVDEEDEAKGYGFCVIIDYSGSNVIADRRELYIDDLCVDEKERGKGIGGMIFEHIREYAKSKGCYHVTLNVWACNEPAMAFYKSKGMAVLKTEMEMIL